VVSRVFVTVLLLLSLASAADLKVKVVDPSSAPIARAQVMLLPKGSQTPITIDSTTAEGFVTFSVADGEYSVRVLAPGFAQETVDITSKESSTVVKLRVAPATETVVVTATRTPVPSEAANADVTTLSSSQIQLMNPPGSNDALRFLPGAIINTSGRRGSLASLFVRGGESRYNKVILDGVTVDDPGGTFDFGVIPLNEVDRMEVMRGAQSTLYGSDAMTSVVQMWTANGTTRVPEFRFGADGGTFGTAHGYLTVAGARGIFDYNVFADQFNTLGQGINDDYSNSLQGGNIGIQLDERVALRIRARHSNNRTGVQNSWDFNGSPLEPPDPEQWARQNNFLASVELDITGPSRWQHRISGFEYHHVRANVNDVTPGRVVDFAFNNRADINRAGVDYQGDYQERTWARTTVGYQFEDENGFTGDLNFPPLTHGTWLNHSVFGQQQITYGRLTAVGGVRYEHHGGYGNNVSPRVGFTYQALRGNDFFSGTSLRFTYATGFKEPRMEEAFAGPPFSNPNPGLKPERNRSFETGVQQKFLGGKYSATATYFNNTFYDRIDYSIDQTTFIGTYVNVNKSFAQGAELELDGQVTSRVTVHGGYTYTSTQNLEAPLCTPANFCDPIFAPGTPLLRRPKHAGTALISYLGNRWGANLGGSFIGWRPDNDFSGFNIDHAAGYALVNLGGWYAINRHVSAYVNLENILNRQYNEVVGYPGLKANFRAGMRFTFGGE
jgi:outer membrane cobalamin receptor